MGETEEITAARPASIQEGELKATFYEHGDKALNFLTTHEPVTFTKEEEKAVLWKIDRVLMPLMIVSYMIQNMDKSVMAQSAIYDLQKSLNLVGQEYSWCSSIFYFGYLALQPISARLLNRVPLGRFVSVASGVWAVLLFCTAGAFNFTGMMVVRFFLGMAEGGISPAYVLITGAWYKKNEIPLRITLWYCGNGVSGIIQPLIAYGIGHIDDTQLPVWRWFFIIFGLIGACWAVVLWFLMPDTPLTAKFLNERERAIAIERLRDNRTGITNPEYKWDQVKEALLDVKVWYGALYAIACVLPASGIANVTYTPSFLLNPRLTCQTFGTLVIKGFGYTSFQTSLLSTPLGLVEIITLLMTGLVAYNFPDKRCVMQFVCNVPAVIGSALIRSLSTDKKVARLVCYYLTGFTNGSLPMMFALTTTNIAGHTKRAVANSILFVGYCIAFIIGPQFFLSTEAPVYQTAFLTNTITFAIACTAPALYYAYVSWQNSKKRKLIEMHHDAEVYLENEEFFDLTDKQQPHFIYSK